ncbi:GerMN domain-containing protein [Paenibacillus brevis]|uniref:GerMN domain-containing protein n=1 Tax=Paenibacillus brevis TaxID=2841508 RepID=A0ABS6FVZ4_9BACL|nr:GerMN domain-containing protein [Paenibacillus brevis]MBU5674409.1 GerMN domain-containing protein [Paenibacillus brevis]
MNRMSWRICGLVLLLALASGCGQKPGTAQPSGNDEPKVEQGAGSASNNQGSNGAENASGETGTEAPEQQKLSIKSYYTDDQLNELIEKEQTIHYTHDEDKYMAALETLKDSGDSELLPLWKVEFHSAKLSKGMLTVDITLPDEARLGAGGEALAVEALQNTLFQFQEVESIELLVDGQQVESLMGHVELEYPMTRK